ncbi:SPRY domain protein [Dictyocaulus viviparus]|uniref:SPRY domain protein n=1 Tax=Dictyocaulus viviparus TaxID=29172 RepID=A0A0D8Y9H7_DICVI|nr:SPRY domain protein [Dictyocaulus viviparus]
MSWLLHYEFLSFLLRNMYRAMPMWFAKQLARFEDISVGSLLELSRIPATGNSPPCLKLTQKAIIVESGPSEKATMEYIRLSLPVKCNETFLRNKDKETIRKMLSEFKPRNHSVVSQIRQPTIPQEFQDSKEGKKGFPNMMLGVKDLHESDEATSFRSKPASFDDDHENEPLAISQRRRVLTLMNYGLYSFDESVLTWLQIDGEKSNSWLHTIRFTNENHRNIDVVMFSVVSGSMANLSHEDRLAAEERLKEMVDREKPPKKSGGLLSRFRDSSHSRKKGSMANLSHEDRLAAEERLKEMVDREKPPKKSGGLLSRFRDSSHSRKKDIKGKEEKSVRLGGHKAHWRSLDTNSVDVVEAPLSGQKDVLASSDMPSTGPGRQMAARKSSLKKKKKKASFENFYPTSFFFIITNDLVVYGIEFLLKEHLVSNEKRGSQVPFDILADLQQQGDADAMAEHGDKVDEYYFGVRIFPGQDPSQVWVGWVTAQYHFYSPTFEKENVERRCLFAENNQQGSILESVEYRNSYMMNVAELLSHVPDATNAKVSGTLIGCIVDISVGELSFQAAGQNTGVKFKLEPGAMLFPAAFFTPTTAEILQFELGRIKYTYPISSAMFKSCHKSLIPFCPPRLTVQCLEPTYWARVPNETLRTTALKLSDIRGWSVLCDNPVRIMSVYVPEKDESFDILEMIEKPIFLDFHRQTLNLYCKLASHGNQKVAHILCGHVDEDQIMYAVKSHYLSGPMRQGYHDLLIAIHLQTHASARQSMSKEYVIPLCDELQNQNVFDPDSENRHVFSTYTSRCCSPSQRILSNIGRI